MPDESSTTTPKRPHTPWRFFLRGLAISLPTILTIVIILWIAGGISSYIIQPTTAGVKFVWAQFLDESVPADAPHLRTLTNPVELRYCGDEYLVTQDLHARLQSRPEAERTEPWLLSQAAEIYVPLAPTTRVGARAVPYNDYAVVAQALRASEMPTSATMFYMEYAAEQYFKSAFLLSAFAVALVIIALYFLGRFVSVRVGSWIVHTLESKFLGRLPVVRNIYGSVKQITDFLFSEQQIDFRRVVAVEYPRPGIWSLGFVTGESMLDIMTAAGEPCLNVLIPTSPMLMTGYTMCVPRSAVVDINMTVEQAIQFMVSCGVLVAPHQRVTPELLHEQIARRIAENYRPGGLERPRTRDNGDGGRSSPRSAAGDAPPPAQGDGPQP